MRYELTHDSVAKQIYEKASGDVRLRRKIEREIKETHQAFKERKAKPSREDIEYFLPFLDVVNISGEDKTFIQESDRDLKARAIRDRVAILAVIILLAGLAIWAFTAQTIAKSALSDFEQQVFNSEFQQALTFLEGANYEAAISQLDSAKVRAVSASDSLKVIECRKDWVSIKNLMLEGRALLDSEDFGLWYCGLQKFNAADSIDGLAVIQQSIETAEDKIQSAFAANINSATAFSNYRNYHISDTLLQDALKLRPLKYWTASENELLEHTRENLNN